jgi:hypothetical protein
MADEAIKELGIASNSMEVISHHILQEGYRFVDCTTRYQARKNKTNRVSEWKTRTAYEKAALINGRRAIIH